MQLQEFVCAMYGGGSNDVNEIRYRTFYKLLLHDLILFCSVSFDKSTFLEFKVETGGNTLL